MSAERAVPGDRSAVLQHFRLNPFRVLRVSVRTPTARAVWAAEKALNLVRAGMPRLGADPLPWLPEPDEIEIQDAAQRIEEPLRRLVDRLFWFDFEAEGRGEVIREAIRSLDAAAVAAALALPLATPGGDDPAALTDAFCARLEAASLRLLLGFAAMHGLYGATAAPTAVRLGEWQQRHGEAVIPSIHARLGGATSQPSQHLALLKEGVSLWLLTLGDARFRRVAEALVAGAGDDLLSSDDAEVLEKAARARLTDLVAEEVRHLLISGQLDRAAELTRAVAEAVTDRAVWGAAFKPLRLVFQTELSDLDALVAEGVDVASVERYVRRVSALSTRWKGLDDAGLFGLDQLVEGAVTVALRRLLAIHAAVPNEGLARVSRDVSRALTELLKLARSESLQQQIHDANRRVENDLKVLCHFCRARPSGKDVVGLFAKRETHREYMGGNSYRVHYQTLQQVISRCDPCADMHDWVFTWAIYLCVAAGASMALAWYLLDTIQKPIPFEVSSYATRQSDVPWWVMVGGIALALTGVYFLARHLLGVLATPPGQRSYGDIDNCEGMTNMQSHGFSSVSRDYRKGALTRLGQG